MIISGNIDLFRPTSQFWDMVLEAVSRGVLVERSGDQGSMKITAVDEVTLIQIDTFIVAGLYVEGYPFFIKVPEADYNNAIPSYLPNSTYIDENNQTVGYTWSDIQNKSTVDFQLIEGFYYVPSNAFDGTDLNSDIYSQLKTDLYTILSSEEYKALLPQGI